MNEITWIDLLTNEIVFARRKRGSINLIVKRYKFSKIKRYSLERLMRVTNDMANMGLVVITPYTVVHGCYTVWCACRKLAS